MPESGKPVKKDLNLRAMGWEACKKGHLYGPAVRDHCLIHYICSGKGLFRTARGEYPLSKGWIFLIRPGETTYYQADADEPWEYIWLGFDGASAVGLLEKSGLGAEGDILYCPQCEQVFQSLKTVEHMQFAGDIYATSKIYELLASLIEAQGVGRSDMPSVYVSRAQSYIGSNYSREISVGGIADFLGIDRRYFCAIFKKRTKKTPRRYIVDLRLEKGARLMREFGCSPTEAARSCGYQDFSNFSRMFKKKYGVCPSAYKKG